MKTKKLVETVNKKCDMFIEAFRLMEVCAGESPFWLD